MIKAIQNSTLHVAEITIAMAGIAFGCIAIMLIALDYGFHDISRAKEAASSMTIACLLILFVVKAKHLPTKLKVRFQIGLDLSDRLMRFLRLKSIALVLLNFVLLKTCVISIHLILATLGVTASIIADYTGSYELAEKIFKATPLPSEMRQDMTWGSLAATPYFQANTNDPDARDDRLDRVIAEIYGPQSRQLAHRYLVQAESAYGDNYWYRRRYFYEKTLSIYCKHNAPIECTESIARLAAMSYVDGDKEISQRWLHPGLVYLARCPNDEQLIPALRRFRMIADAKGDAALSASLWKREARIRKTAIKDLSLKPTS